MKNPRYYLDATNKQNVWVAHTGGGSQVITELVCVATSTEHAVNILNALTKTKVVELGSYTNEELAEIRQG
jgi:molybdopterin synthase catalytic subunit